MQISCPWRSRLRNHTDGATRRKRTLSLPDVTWLGSQFQLHLLPASLTFLNWQMGGCQCLVERGASATKLKKEACQRVARSAPDRVDKPRLALDQNAAFWACNHLAPSHQPAISARMMARSGASPSTAFEPRLLGRLEPAAAVDHVSEHSQQGHQRVVVMQPWASLSESHPTDSFDDICNMGRAVKVGAPSKMGTLTPEDNPKDTL
jgi:hypothetical protein